MINRRMAEALETHEANRIIGLENVNGNGGRNGNMNGNRGGDGDMHGNGGGDGNGNGNNGGNNGGGNGDHNGNGRGDRHECTTGTLKPIAIKLSLPRALPGSQPKRVLTPPVGVTSNWTSQLAKAHFFLLL
ncbi:linoleate 13S-lipoxygenase 3-1, chloroplastic-like protein [Tanacetum coccineum]